jgi:hypothetical protein
MPSKPATAVLIMAAVALLFAGCETTENQFTRSQVLLNRAIANEPAGETTLEQRQARHVE